MERITRRLPFGGAVDIFGNVLWEVTEDEYNGMKSRLEELFPPDIDDITSNVRRLNDNDLAELIRRLSEEYNHLNTGWKPRSSGRGGKP